MKKRNTEALLKKIVQKNTNGGADPTKKTKPSKSRRGVEEFSVVVAEGDPEFDNEEDFYDYYMDKAWNLIDSKYAKLYREGKISKLNAVKMSPRVRSFPNFEHVMKERQKQADNPLARDEYSPALPKSNILISGTRKGGKQGTIL